MHSLLKCCCSYFFWVDKTREHTHTHSHTFTSTFITLYICVYIMMSSNRSCPTPQGSIQLSTFSIYNSLYWTRTWIPLSLFHQLPRREPSSHFSTFPPHIDAFTSHLSAHARHWAASCTDPLLPLPKLWHPTVGPWPSVESCLAWSHTMPWRLNSSGRRRRRLHFFLNPF